MVFLKVGIEKVVIDQETGATELKVPSSVLISVLEEMRSNIESLVEDRESQEARDFWELAIKQAKPKTTPKDGGTWPRWSLIPTSFSVKASLNVAKKPRR